MNHDIERCPACSRPFAVREIPLQMPGTKDREPIDCPYCGINARHQTSNGYFVTSKLTPEDEAAYEKEFPRR
ncbi:MAG: hypothetical protein EOO27_23915 [Comamonadaceae bacterium]|nr:MAG: hypothetical protein EOO27_23915 [Comamonadaceae bacterium]